VANLAVHRRPVSKPQATCVCFLTFVLLTNQLKHSKKEIKENASNLLNRQSRAHTFLNGAKVTVLNVSKIESKL
jgi:hypothetical protein